MKQNKHKYKGIFQGEEYKNYKKVLKEIEHNKQYYLSAKPQDVANSLIKNCQISKKELYVILKKINLTNKDNPGSII